jgi:hypothetical protein
VSVKIDGNCVDGVTAENLETVFAEHVLSPVSCSSH